MPKTQAKMESSVKTLTGPLSSTEWIVTSTPPFGLLSSSNLTEVKKNDSVFSYHSPKTSLRGLVVVTDEPICSLHILLSTESNGGASEAFPSWHHPDDGLPHTLEHLVFLGSLTHPHKGVLDKLANRCMADGTNAWTATDHTAYTLSTAGSEGAINLMPIFADHVLFPTLKESGFVTEVHHVNGEGEDKGVVYCEMQGRENSGGSLVDRAVMSLLYPDISPSESNDSNTDSNNSNDNSSKKISCGYASETGGKLANLRTLTVDKVRRYHREYYTPDNTILILTGNVVVEDYFKALDEVESLILKRLEERSGKSGEEVVDGNCDATWRLEEFESSRKGRPWINSPIPPFETSTTASKPGLYPPYTSKKSGNKAPSTTSTPLTITFPSEDESRGTISLAWRGPPYNSTSRSTWHHLGLLWDYLTDSAASPLQLAFVENDSPLCADLGPAHEVFTEGYHQIWFQEVDVERMGEVVDLFYDVIAEQAGADSEGEFDLTRMKTVIGRERRQLLERSERRPTSAIIDGIVRNFLYGPRAGELNNEVNEVVTPQQEMAALHSDVNVLPLLDEAEALLDDSTYWRSLLKEYILDRPMAVVFGMPSAQMAKELADKEKQREAQQAQDIGTEGLQKLQQKLEKSMASNEEPIPQDVLTSLPVPDLEKVASIPLFTVRLSPSTHSPSLAIIPDSLRDVTKEDAESIVQALKQDAQLSSQPPVSSFHADLTHIESNFVFSAVGIDTTPLTPQQRLYLPLLSEILFKLPAILEDGSQITKEDFVNQLHEDTVYFSGGVGLLGGSIPQMSYVAVQVENGSDGNGLSTALKWIARVLYRTIITTEAVRTAVQRLISEIPPQVRHGPSVVATVAAELSYDEKKANVIAGDLFRQKGFLGGIAEKIGTGMRMGEEDDEAETEEECKDGEAGPEEVGDPKNNGNDEESQKALEAIVKELENIRKTLFQITNMHAFVAANLKNTPKLLETLVQSFNISNIDAPKEDVLQGRLIENVSASSVLKPNYFKKEEIKEKGGEGAVVALSAIESGFLNIIAPGIKAYDPNRASLLVAIEYLTALEGDFWVKLRGAGLTYSYSISDSTDSQLMKFSLFKCTDVPAAFEKALGIIVEYAKGERKMEEIGLENAKASLAYQIISGRSSKLSAATSSFVRVFKGEKMDYDRHLLSRIAEVTAEDAMHALVTHLVPIFDPSSKLAIACPTNKLDAIHEYFVKRGWTNLKKVTEDEMFSAFVEDGKRDETPALPEKVPGMSMFLPGAFAAQFRCACPKCDR